MPSMLLGSILAEFDQYLALYSDNYLRDKNKQESSVSGSILK
jgi:hypothetical protein